MEQLLLLATLASSSLAFPRYSVDRFLLLLARLLVF
jgi:hypothetical protein